MRGLGVRSQKGGFWDHTATPLMTVCGWEAVCLFLVDGTRLLPLIAAE